MVQLALLYAYHNFIKTDVGGFGTMSGVQWIWAELVPCYLNHNISRPKPATNWRLWQSLFNPRGWCICTPDLHDEYLLHLWTNQRAAHITTVSHMGVGCWKMASASLSRVFNSYYQRCNNGLKLFNMLFMPAYVNITWCDRRTANVHGVQQGMRYNGGTRVVKAKREYLKLF